MFGGILRAHEPRVTPLSVRRRSCAGSSRVPCSHIHVHQNLYRCPDLEVGPLRVWPSEDEVVLD